ncbi:MAG: hypothetical protein JO090_13850 [Rhizobacter sp.]|nr:hypothetical protein [Rhizobacter sp.]
MQNAMAFCHNDVVVVAWRYCAKLAGWMSFTVERIANAWAQSGQRGRPQARAAALLAERAAGAVSVPWPKSS